MIALQILAAVLCLGFELLGIFARRALTPPSAAVVLLAYGLPFLALLISEIAAARVVRQYDGMSVAEVQDVLQSNKEMAPDELLKKRASLRRIRALSDLWAVLLGIFALTGAFLAGLKFDTGLSVPLWFVSSAMLVSSFGRIRSAPVSEVLSEEAGYIDRAELPQLYALADKAAQMLGCRQQIHIAPTADFNAGVARIGNAVSITLGTRLMRILSEDELFTVLLHELSHIAGDHALKERLYSQWLEQERDQQPLAFLATRFFNYLDARYAVEFTLYDLAASVQMEAEADSRMAEYASKEAAGSALLKLKYYALFLWENEAYFTHDTLDKTLSWLVRDEAEAFLAALDERSADWHTLMQKEIQASNASHPTAQMRLAAIGAADAQAAQPLHSESFAAEIDHAQELLIARLKASNDEQAYDARIARMRKTVADWEAEGRPLVVEEYTDVISALRDLGRLDDALAICERAIREFDADTPVAYPYYLRGCARLHQWDESGLDDIYRAFRQSTSGDLIEEGLDQIGEFCCLTGNQTELERYRKAGVQLMQKEKDVYRELSVLRRSDELSAEKLPEDLNRSLYRYIRSFAGEAVDAIYLVRKTITEDFSTSVMIVRFSEGADEEARGEIMHKIFNVLDNNTHWQFSLFEYEDVRHVRPETIPGSLFYENPKYRE